MRLDNPAGTGRQVARISYYTAASGFLAVATPDGEASLPLRSGPNVADFVVEGPLDDLEMRMVTSPDAPEGSTVCVVEVVVGYPVPG